MRIALPPMRRARIGSFACGAVEIARRVGRRRAGERGHASATAATVVEVVQDGRVEMRQVTAGLADGASIESATGSQPGETVVARAAAFLRAGDRGAADRRPLGRAAVRSRAMRLNISAWAIRKPMPAIVLFARADAPRHRSASARCRSPQFPNIDIPIVQVTITQSGAAPVGARDRRSPRRSRTPSPA